MLYVLVLASIALILSLFKLHSSIRSRESIFGAIILFIIPLALVIFSGNQVIHEKPSTAASTASSHLAAKKSKEASIKDDKFEKMNSDSQAASQQAAKERNITASLKKNLKPLGDLTFNADQKVFVVTPTDANSKKAFSAWVKDPRTIDKDSYAGLKKQFTGLSKSLKKELGAGYTVKLLQTDSNRALLVVKDGKIVEDALAS
ncbi:hypothetical protein QY883_05710 [Pediococcus acidilactici]|uniref:hypothetical protein n=1 Tax=Pediococcus acidilactici TaxID=1254 RepID=UPI00032710EB|nr:hypothetical protein [Pediococcus acidilactici]EOA09244.1 hypothetical protein PAD3_0335 [Pediococcus acidilactici D3]MBW4796731.1 hypothetical protein [Pediococcus acidilactici]MBW9305981.1 hypothetical protein [Pediococcus acidilactici]MCE5961594.1 hypothetical protein [Pediococcus acidilactici]MCW8082531.1 hypothetical protein [Pediococcus acidilactici]